MDSHETKQLLRPGTRVMNTVMCPHCGASLPPPATADGWCEACGKKIPAWILREVSRSGKGESSSGPHAPSVARQEAPTRLPTVPRSSPPHGQSPLVTPVGVINLAFGGLFFLFGIYCLVAGAAAVNALLQLKQETAKAAAQM